MKLLDTTVAIDHLRGDRAAVDLLRDLVENDETVAASEVRFELVAGVRDDELPALEQLFPAPTALLLEAELLTTNVRHFPMLPGLRSPY